MTRDELMQIGHDAGFDTSELTGEVIALLECVAEHAEAKERAARIESQQRLADMQELAAKSGLAHRMAVQRCVQAAVAEAVAAEREALLETLGEADVLVVNFMRVAGIDKHAARECADVVRELVSNHADGDRARGTA